LFIPVKEKSWSVLLDKGYILNDQVRAERCLNCKLEPELLIASCNNPNILLYGCSNSKCKHRLLRLDFGIQASSRLSQQDLNQPNIEN
jgi:hypothetical protein